MNIKQKVKNIHLIFVYSILRVIASNMPIIYNCNLNNVQVFVDCKKDKSLICDCRIDKKDIKIMKDTINIFYNPKLYKKLKFSTETGGCVKTK